MHVSAERGHRRPLRGCHTTSQAFGMPTPTPDQRIARLAARHHGLLTRSRALSCGFSDRQISTRLATGRWESLAPGVYRIGGAPPTDAQRAYAAVLAAGREAVVCGTSSLALLGIGTPPDVPTICVPPTGSARTAGAAVRRSPLDPRDRTLVGPIPATVPARALLEAAALVDERSVEGLLDDVLCAGLATPSHVVGAIHRSATGRGRTGAAVLREALEPWLRGIEPDSPAEMRLVRRIVDWGLPEPDRQVRVRLSRGGIAVLDLAWPRARVGLEYDGARWHTPRRLERDLARELELAEAGWWIGRADRHDLAPSSTRLRDELRARLIVRAA